MVNQQAAVKINTLCRVKEPSIKFFWSDSFGDEAIFFSDFGPIFQFRKDQPANNNAANNGSSSSGTLHFAFLSAINILNLRNFTNVAPISVESLKFPSLQETLQKPWKSIPSRHVELSPIYIRFSTLIRFRQLHGRNPTQHDEAEFGRILIELLTKNEVDLISALAPSIPTLLAVVDNGLVLNSSILGSFLSQEVIKAVSLQGTPGVNVFVYNGKDNSVKCIPIV
jgi:hypothetical protein